MWLIHPPNLAQVSLGLIMHVIHLVHNKNNHASPYSWIQVSVRRCAVSLQASDPFVGGVEASQSWILR